jgi:hypothetical protein
MLAEERDRGCRGKGRYLRARAGGGARAIRGAGSDRSSFGGNGEARPRGRGDECATRGGLRQGAGRGWSSRRVGRLGALGWGVCGFAEPGVMKAHLKEMARLDREAAEMYARHV